MKQNLAEQVLDKWTSLKTNLKQRASNLENENNNLKSENKILKFKVNWLLVLISLGLISWLVTE